MSIYADNAATTPCLPEVAKAVAAACATHYGNPSSTHYHLGRQSRAVIDDARQALAKIIGIERAGEISFTSGATESCNMAIMGVMQRCIRTRPRIVAMDTEHPAVLQPISQLTLAGADVQTAKCEGNGQMNLDHLHSLCNEKTAIVCAMLVNNETGVIQNINRIASIAHDAGALVLCDATQALGKVRIDDLQHNVDFLAFSAHKCYGPKGVGALWTRRHLSITPLLLGGGQERGRRSGTENVPGIAGWLAALNHMQGTRGAYVEKIARLHKLLEAIVSDALPEVIINGQDSPRAPGFTSLTLPGLRRGWLAQLHGICASGGSSCASGQNKPSRVLETYGRSREDAANSLRLSLGIYNTDEEVAEIAEQVIAGARRLKDSVARGAPCSQLMGAYEPIDDL